MAVEPKEVDVDSIVISEDSDMENDFQSDRKREIDKLIQSLEETEQEITNLENEKLKINELLSVYRPQAEEIRKKISILKTKQANSKDWSEQKYSWSNDINKILHDVFKFNNFKFAQLSAINATLSKKDLIVIMPTGGGKSLIYQLPALVTKGITIVISPLLSLITDQLRHLQRLNINAITINSSNSSKMNSVVNDTLGKGIGNINLIYVTPEWISKSKRFMSNLQKAYERGAIDRIAIDEVHCCSLWGHDFRPDYKNLHIFKNVFPNIPILGVTATATEKVICETQDLLGISGCLVLKAPYNRPNLIYSVHKKPCTLKESAEYLFNLIKKKYPNDTGIIYTHSINDSVDLAMEFKNLGLTCAPYHAMMENDKRDEVHKKWVDKKYQVICATVAFGMGIDKPDVRFVIHHSIPKSMENYYQESGRAGRDGKEAECILLYSIRDIFRVSALVATSSQNGTKYLYEVVRYCLEREKCRRQLIAVHFNEKWKLTDCNQHCDNCIESHDVVNVDVRKDLDQLLEIIEKGKMKHDTNMTALKLMDAWFQVGGEKKLRLTNTPPPKITRDFGERILAYLLIKDYLKENLHFTAYTTISYIGKGRKVPEKIINMEAPKLETPKHLYIKSEYHKSETKSTTSKNVLDKSKSSESSSQNSSKHDKSETKKEHHSKSREKSETKKHEKSKKNLNTNPSTSKTKPTNSSTKSNYQSSRKSDSDTSDDVNKKRKLKKIFYSSASDSDSDDNKKMRTK